MTLSTSPRSRCPLATAAARALDHRERCLPTRRPLPLLLDGARCRVRGGASSRRRRTPSARRADARPPYHLDCDALGARCSRLRTARRRHDAHRVHRRLATYGVSTAFHVYKTARRGRLDAPPTSRRSTSASRSTGWRWWPSRATTARTRRAAWLDPVSRPALFTFFFLRRALVDYDGTYLPDQAECARRRAWLLGRTRDAAPGRLVCARVRLGAHGAVRLPHARPHPRRAVARRQLLSTLILTLTILLVGLIGDGYHACCGPPSRPSADGRPRGGT